MTQKPALFLLLLIFGSFSCSVTSSAFGRKSQPTPPPAPPPAPQQPAPIVGAEHRSRYNLLSASQKLVDNKGNGYEDLYGTRNLRAVLNGVYYRGGANNYYHRVNKRENSNPLPNDGLENLCEEGFGRAVYLYATNYDTAPKQLRCQTFNRHENQIQYLQASILSYRESDIKNLLSLIHEHIRNPRLGPIYEHCWNGWHASGFAAVTALRQFCGFTAEQGVKYWDLNTDGNNKESGYERVRQQIRKFVPFSDLEISAEEKRALCPNPDTLAFNK